MATRVQVIDTKYFNELTNASDFSTNTGDFSDHLLGHAGDRQKLEVTIQVSNTFVLGRYTITGGNTITLKDGQNFLNEDFYAGGKAYLSLVGTGFNNWEFDIQTISPDGSELVAVNIVEKDNSGTPTGPVILPDGEYGTGAGTDVLRSLVESNGLVTKFGFVPNSGPVSYASPLDNIQQAYKFDGLRPGGAPGPVITGTWDNSIQGSNTGTMTAQFIQTITDNGVIKDGISTSTAAIDSIQEFKIIQEFILPYYEQGDFSNVQDQIPTDWIADSLKQVFEFDFRQNLSNPNVSQFGEYNTVLGNVKWYNDNYIDTAQEYNVSDVALIDTATSQTLNEINASSTTRVTASILSGNSTFLTSDPVLIEHSYLPNSDQYAGQTDVFTDVWLRETLRNNIDAVAADGTIITGFTATLVNAGQIDIQFDISFSTAQQTRIQQGYNYELSIKVADSSLTVPFSDVTKLIIQANQYTLNTDITGLANFPQSYVYTRPMMYPIVAPGDRFTSLRGWIQDGFLYDWTLNLDLVEEATLEALTLRLVAFNTLENTWFELDNYNYDLSGQVVTVGPPDVQNIEIDTTRGYDLADGDKLNFAKLQTGTYSAPNQPYTGQTAFRLSWQDWIALPNADTVFYNPAEPNNGLNKNSSHYSLQNNYVICVLIDARIGKVVDGVNVITQYINRSANLEVYDFGEQDGSPIVWAGVIQTFDDQGADLGGSLLTEGLTTIKGTFDGDIAVVDPSLYWGEVRLERLNNPGNDYFVLSTLEAGEDNNPLQAPTGSTYAKIELISGDIVVSADLNPDLLPDAGPWNPSVRMGLIDESIPVVPTVKIQIDGNTRQVDGDFIEFQQTEIMSAATFVDNVFSLSEAVSPFPSTGWMFKVSPTSSYPTWGALSYVEWNTVAAAIGAASDLWVYAEANDTTKIDEGFIIEYEKPQVGQGSSSVLLTYPANTIDLDKTIYFDRKIIISSFGTLSGSNESYVQVVSAEANTDDYTDLDRYTTGIGAAITDLATINAAIASLGDGVKYGIRFAHRKDDIASGTQTFEFDYDSAEDCEKSLSVSQSDIDLKYRTFGDSLYFGPYTNSAPNTYASTAVGDTALLNLFDPVAGTGPWTWECWVIPQHEFITDGNTRTHLFGPNLQNLANGAGTSIALGALNEFIQVALGDNNSAKKAIRWQVDFSKERILHLVITSPGDGDINNVNVIANGLKMPADEINVLADNPYNSTGVPVDGLYRYGLYQNRTNKVSNADRVSIMRVYDRILTSGEIRDSFNNPNKTHSNLFRDWDFGAASGANVTENVGAFDMTLTGAAPARIPFYDF